MVLDVRRVEPALEKPAELFGRMHALTMGAYYTTQEGWKDIGYLGNTPITGDYPGPTPEATRPLATTGTEPISVGSVPKLNSP